MRMGCRGRPQAATPAGWLDTWALSSHRALGRGTRRSVLAAPEKSGSQLFQQGHATWPQSDYPATRTCAPAPSSLSPRPAAARPSEAKALTSPIFCTRLSVVQPEYVVLSTAGSRYGGELQIRRQTRCVWPLLGTRGREASGDGAPKKVPHSAPKQAPGPQPTGSRRQWPHFTARSAEAQEGSWLTLSHPAGGSGRQTQSGRPCPLRTETRHWSGGTSCLLALSPQHTARRVPGVRQGQNPKPGGKRLPGPQAEAHSHLLPHLLEVIEELQGCAEAFGNEAAALATATHKPAGARWSGLGAPRHTGQGAWEHWRTPCSIPGSGPVPWPEDGSRTHRQPRPCSDV